MDIILFILLILTPGYLLSRLMLKELDVFLIPPISFTLGLVLLVLAAIPSYLFSLTFLQSSLIILTYLGALLFAIVIKGKLVSLNWPKLDFNSISILTLVFGAALMMIFINPHFDGDALFHIGQIRKLAENSPVSSTEAFFPIEKINPAYAYNIWYFAVAIVAALAKIDTALVWSHLVFILVPISLLALYSFASALFRDRVVALVSTVVYVFLIGSWANAWEFRIAPYPDQIARHIVLYISLFFFLQFVALKEKKYLYLTVLVGALLPMIHMYSFVHFLIAVGTFSIASFFLLGKKIFANSVRVIIGSIFLAAPYLMLKLQNAETVIGTVTLKKDAWILFDRVFIINPFYGSYVPLFLVVFALFYLLYINRKSLKNKIWLIFLASNAFASFLILYNPIVAPIISKLITYTYFHRLGYLVYRELIIAAFLVFVVFAKENKFRLTTQLKNLLLVTILSMLILMPSGYNITKKVLENEKEAAELIEYIKLEVPEKSVIAADLWTSYRIPAYSNNYIIATFPTHMTSNVNKFRVIEDLKIIFSPKSSFSDAKKILDNYKVSYVVVNSQPKRNDILIHQSKFSNKKELKKVYTNNVYTLYSYKKE